MRTPDLNWIKDPRVFQVNRLQAYSDHIYTIGKDKKPSSFSLNGTWKFNLSKNYDSCFKFFYNTEFNSKSLSKLIHKNPTINHDMHTNSINEW